MHELDRIRLALVDAAERGEGAVLATVVDVGGSTVGAVSGGCLEADIVARAAELLASGSSELAHYDTRSSDDGVLGLGMGCQGVIEVGLDPLTGGALTRAVG